MSIHHINIVVSDLKKTREFFQLFGFTLHHEKTIKGEWLDQVAGLKDVSFV